MAAPQQGPSPQYERIFVSDTAHPHLGDVHYTTSNHFAASEPPPQPLSTIPFPRDRTYVHRGPLDDEIQEQLSEPGSRVALVGLGGVGKSQLAIEHGYRAREQSPSTWVLWLHLSSNKRFVQNVRDTVEQLKVPGWNDHNADVFKLFRTWLRDPKYGKWLIILDNVDDADVLLEPPSYHNQSEGSGGESQYRERCIDYLPASSHGSILVTSRSMDVALEIVERKALITVDLMSEEHAIQLVHLKSTEQHSNEDAAMLSRELECMPLAITQAVAFIDQSLRCTVAQYLEDLRKSDTSWHHLLTQDLLDLRRDRDAKHSILLTWQISFELLYQTKRSAADLLSLMSICDRQSIPESLLSTAEGGSTFEGATFEADMQTLRNYCLISTTAEVATFRMHRLVQQATQAWLKSHERLEPWKCQLVRNLNKAFPETLKDSKDRASSRRLFPQALVASHLELAHKDAILHQASLLQKCSNFALDFGDLANAERMTMKALNNRRALLGDEHLYTMHSVHHLVLFYYLSKRWGEAERTLLQAIETEKRLLGHESPLTRHSMAMLAHTYAAQERWKEAEDVMLKVLEAHKQLLGDDHEDTLSSMDELAVNYNREGRSQEVENVLMQVLEAQKRSIGDEHPRALRTMHALALIYYRQGWIHGAERLLVKVLEARQRLLGEEHQDTATSMFMLALMRRARGEKRSATALVELCAAKAMNMYGSEHRRTIALYRKLEKWKQDGETGTESWNQDVGSDMGDNQEIDARSEAVT